MEHSKSMAKSMVQVMFHVQYLGTNQKVLADEMRHSSLDSSICYTKATTSQQIKLKTDFIEKLHELIPSLCRES